MYEPACEPYVIQCDISSVNCNDMSHISLRGGILRNLLSFSIWHLLIDCEGLSFTKCHILFSKFLSMSVAQTCRDICCHSNSKDCNCKESLFSNYGNRMKNASFESLTPLSYLVFDDLSFFFCQFLGNETLDIRLS